MHLRQLLFALASLGLCGPCAAAPQRAAAVEPVSPFAGMHWRCIGPFRGGRSVAVTGVPGYPERFYFGAVGGGVWRSDNAGNTWSAIFDAEHVASIGAIAVAPSDANVIYVGSGEADFRSDLQEGNGMYKSIDAGRTWQRIGLTDTRAIGRISVDPHDANDVIVAALGHPYGPNAERGVFRSRDGGTTWRKTLFVNDDTGAVTVARDPQHPAVVFAAMLQTRRPPWNVYPPSKGPGSGLYKSIDGGETWHAVRGNGFPDEGLGRIGVAVAPTNSARVYAVVDAKDGGVYRSDDAGATWKRLAGDRRLWGRGWYFEEVAVDPRNADRLYVSNTSVYRSADGGATFTAIKGAPGGDDYHMLWIDPHDGDRMILASDQGVVVSVDGAKSWSSWYNQPTAQIYHVSTDERFPFWVYGAQQDSGAIAVVSRSSRRGILAGDTSPIQAGGESDEIAPDPLHPGVLYGSRVVREDLATRSVRQLPATQALPGDWRDTWTLPLTFSATDPGVLYFSHQVLFRTADAGNTWSPISPDLTRDNPGNPANLDAPTIADRDDPKTPPRGVIYTIAPSPLQRGTIWIGTDDGSIQRTRDEGKTWTNVTPAGLQAWSKIGILEASHFAAETAFAAVDRHRLDDDKPYIYRTRDGGRTWRDVVSGIPDGSFVNAVREDPERSGLLYAGTETGVYVSFDDGDRWQPLQLDLPRASVRDLVLRDDALVIATHGRSFWILDDVTPLRQWNATAAKAAAWLFAPQTAYRIGRYNDEGTPTPPETPAGENPPDGAIIDYTLGSRGAQNVALDIFDAAGATIRHWSSSEPVAPPDPTKFPFPMFWVTTPPALAATPGMHRFIWDLHSEARVAPPPQALDDPSYVGGLWVVPGTYRLRLTVDGRRLERPLTVKLDPREHATPDDLAAQLAFSRDVEDLLVDVLQAARRQPRNEKLAPIEAELGALEDTAQSAPAAPTADARAALARQRDAYKTAMNP